MNIYELKEKKNGGFKLSKINNINLKKNYFSSNNNSEDSSFDFDMFYHDLKSIFNLFNTETEHHICLFFDKNFNTVGVVETDTGNEERVTVSFKKIIFSAVSLGAAGVITCHNHPNGPATPSGEDIKTFLSKKKALASCQILLVDCIIYTDNDYFSFQENDIYELNLNEHGLEEAISNAEVDNELDKDEPWFQYTTEDDCILEICNKISHELYVKNHEEKRTE